MVITSTVRRKESFKHKKGRKNERNKIIGTAWS